MKKFKITFFNPETIKKREFRFVFKWDGYNHCWLVTVISLFDENTTRYSGDPIRFVNNYRGFARNGEYVTIKCA